MADVIETEHADGGITIMEEDNGTWEEMPKKVGSRRLRLKKLERFVETWKRIRSARIMAENKAKGSQVV